MKNFLIIGSFLWLFISAPVSAQVTPESISNSALEDLKSDGATKFIENLIANAPLVEAKMTERTTLLSSLNTILSVYGQVEGWELIREKTATERYKEHGYLVFLEKYAMRLTLKFYKTADGWTVTSFYFDDKIDQYLPE